MPIRRPPKFAPEIDKKSFTGGPGFEMRASVQTRFFGNGELSVPQPVTISPNDHFQVYGYALRQRFDEIECVPPHAAAAMQYIP